MMHSRNLLEIQNLKVEFNMSDGSKLHTVNGVDLDLKEGEILGIVGESGSGKTQTMLSLIGLLAKNAKVTGKAIFQGKDLLSLKTKDLNSIRGKDITMVFQDHMTSLNPYLKIKTQLLESIVNKNNFTKKQLEVKALEMLTLVGISDPKSRLYSYVHEISGGMRQRVMIAMALISNPKLLIADEPTTALDVTIQAQILNILFNLKKKLKLSIILVTHDLGIVANFCDRVAIFYGGKVVEVGELFNIFKNPRHPYTKALLNTVPRIDQSSKKELPTIPGIPKVYRNEPNLCVFRDRCVEKIHLCNTVMPKLKIRGTDSKVCCLLDR